jgi:hypothetical protein
VTILDAIPDLVREADTVAIEGFTSHGPPRHIHRVEGSGDRRTADEYARSHRSATRPVSQRRGDIENLLTEADIVRLGRESAQEEETTP